VKSGVADPKNLTKLLKKAGKGESVPPAGGHGPDDDPIAVLIFSFLLWEATTKQATDAMKKLMDATVDYNDLRVCLPNEIAELIGTRYPHALERAQRLKLTLQSIYLDQYAVSLDHLAEKGKREAKAFMESLRGITPYVSARVLQRCFGVHQVPVDDRLVDLLIEAKVLTEVVEAGVCSSWISRQVKSQEGLEISDALRGFVDDSPKPPKRPGSRPIVLPYEEPVLEEDADGTAEVASTTAAAATAGKKAATKSEEPKASATKKAPLKKVVKKPVPPKTTKKTAASAKTAKKTAPKKAASKKAVSKKAASKKAASKKAAVKKTVAKKAAKKKTAKKKTQKK
jgi:endonuclease III